MIKIEELNIEVEDASDYEDEASEILTEFCNDLEAAGETRPITEDDYYEFGEGCQFIWSPKAGDLIRAELDRLGRIGLKYFPEGVDISSHMYIEP